MVFEQASNGVKRKVAPHLNFEDWQSGPICRRRAFPGMNFSSKEPVQPIATSQLAGPAAFWRYMGAHAADTGSGRWGE